MRIPYFQVSAFAPGPFGGNPAGVCVLKNWISDELLQRIATENDLSETAFLVPLGEDFELRWFTPAIEVDLCGHATLASAFVLFQELDYKSDTIRFKTKSGWLAATRRAEIVELDFPARPADVCPAPGVLVQGLGQTPEKVLKSRDYLAVFPNASDVAALKPDIELLSQVDCLGIIVTAPGGGADFVSRFFAPRAGIAEDPVTGSAHCTLIPYWAKRLGKNELFAKQISKRGGELYCRYLDERVGIGGQGRVYLRGEIEV
jgi:predicted PhzF superfamily epimerase YddE/YHI9